MKHFDTRLRRLEAQTPAPDWTVGEGLSSLLKAFKAEAEGADEEPLDLVRIPRISATQSTGLLPRNPWECCHLVQRISATQSTGMLPPSERSDAGS